MLPAEGVHTPTAPAEPAEAAHIKPMNTERMAHPTRQPRLNWARTVTYNSKHIKTNQFCFNVWSIYLIFLQLK